MFLCRASSTHVKDNGGGPTYKFTSTSDVNRIEFLPPTVVSPTRPHKEDKKRKTKANSCFPIRKLDLEDTHPALVLAMKFCVQFISVLIADRENKGHQRQ